MSFIIRKTRLWLVDWLAGVDFQYRWLVEGQGHCQGYIRRGLRTLCGLAVGGGSIRVIFLYKYVVGGEEEVEGDCRNIFHERSV